VKIRDMTRMHVPQSLVPKNALLIMCQLMHEEVGVVVQIIELLGECCGVHKRPKRGTGRDRQGAEQELGICMEHQVDEWEDPGWGTWWHQ
jgi:hypothetical protein